MDDFLVWVVWVVAAFAVQISRRKAYERGEYDPDDVFHLHHPIRPAAAA